MTKTVNDLFKQSKTEWLEDARDAARKLLKVRYSITIEDVLEACPLPKYLHRNTIGSVFNHDDFKSIGFENSRRTAMHSRIIRIWTAKLAGDREANNSELPDDWDAIKSQASEGDDSRLAVID